MTQTDVACPPAAGRMTRPASRSRPPAPGRPSSSGSLLARASSPSRPVVVQRLLEQGLWLAVVGVALRRHGASSPSTATRRAVPAEVPAARAAAPPGPAALADRLHRRPRPSRTTATATAISKQESIDSHHRQLGAGGAGHAALQAVGRGQGGRRHRDRRRRLPAHRPAGRHRRSATVKGLEDLPADGVEKAPIGKITTAPGYTILNARAGQRPQGPRHVRRARPATAAASSASV